MTDQSHNSVVPVRSNDERIVLSFICKQTGRLSPALANAGLQTQTDVMIRFRDIWSEKFSHV